MHSVYWNAYLKVKLFSYKENKMKALITGASSGLGWEMAEILSEEGYDIIAVARRAERLKDLKNKLKTNVEIVCVDVTTDEGIEKISGYFNEIDVFINNAGFGVFGKLVETDLSKELEMINVNVKAMHILTKLAACKFKERNSGYIMNVASIAAFFPGPLFSAYYATKAYVFRLTESLYEELRKAGSNVKISVLCPGPVKTEFENVAGVSFGKGNGKGKNLIVADKKKVASYAINQMIKGKFIIIPGMLMKICVFFRRILSEKTLCKLLYNIQNSKFIH